MQTWRLNKIVQKNQTNKKKWVNKEMKEEILKCLETNEEKHNFPKSVGCNKIKEDCKREVYSNTGLPQKTRKNTAYKQPNF